MKKTAVLSLALLLTPALYSDDGAQAVDATPETAGLTWQAAQEINPDVIRIIFEFSHEDEYDQETWQRIVEIFKSLIPDQQLNDGDIANWIDTFAARIKEIADIKDDTIRGKISAEINVDEPTPS